MNLSEEQKAIAENAKDRFNVKPDDFKKVAKSFYDEGFAKAKFEEAEDLLHISEIVRNKK